MGSRRQPGFEKKLQLVGVGYRAQGKGKVLNLSLGFSHPIDFPVPGRRHHRHAVADRDRRVRERPAAVGQVAAEIRAFRRRSPKGKGGVLFG